MINRDDIMQQALEALEGVSTDEHLAAIKALRERLAQPEFDSALQSAAMTQTATKLAQPEQWEYCKRGLQTGVCYCKQPQQEPFGWAIFNIKGSFLGFSKDKPRVLARPLYLEAQRTEPQQEPVGWQPIDTAPKTGKKVILFYLNRNNLPRRVMARWLTDEQAAEKDWDNVGLEGGWYECIDNWDDYTEVAIHEGEPSHWMPLPAEPHTTPQPNNIANSEAIPEQISEQEPVAWWLPKHPHPDMVSRVKWSDECEPLYTTPPRREWQGLTDEVDELAREMVKGNKSVNWLALAIEAKLREKNA